MRYSWGTYERDDIIKLYNNQVFLMFLNESNQYLQSLFSNNEVNVNRREVFDKVKDSPRVFYDILKKTWELHNTLSLTELECINIYNSLLSSPRSIELLLRLFETHFKA